MSTYYLPNPETAWRSLTQGVQPSESTILGFSRDQIDALAAFFIKATCEDPHEKSGAEIDATGDGYLESVARLRGYVARLRRHFERILSDRNPATPSRDQMLVRALEKMP